MNISFGVFRSSRIGTLTDGNADPRCIEGLRDVVDFCVSSVEAGAEKPDRRTFSLCEAKSRLLPEQLVMVGDNIGKDVMGAKAAGWRAIWVVPPRDGVAGSAHDLSSSGVALTAEASREAADATVESVAGVAGVLRSWSGEGAEGARGGGPAAEA
ncbi:unnamed protein product [Prorocentrum cordatum]|uniref:Uncharacterized protein n=1 Tax=Prorocentrum cordatum TaxID=2364126 RepID=A0ABN9XCZ6_9DINO|nr:unnamed protein product [Polarella glacialis]